MANKPPSKNSRCPCGSGKKYRKCHGKNKQMIAHVEHIFRQKEAKERSFTAKYGKARPPMSVMMGDKRMIVIGGSIYKQTRDGPYNFMNAIHDNGLEFFGIPYMEVEEAKPFEERHPALQWMHTFVDHSQRLEREGKEAPRAGQIGAGAAWFRFAYDIFTIRDNAKLEARLKKRLLDSKDFQGARHELAVAAMCIAAGFDLEFEDETDNTQGHPEFIATDRVSKARIAVEAKSRHRRGIKGFAGGRDMNPGDKVDVRGLVLDAFRKAGPLPLYVFIDVNLPPVANEATWERWMLELHQTMVDLQAEGYGDSYPANGIYFTNDPSHYLCDQPVGNDSDKIWIKHYEADTPRLAHPAPDMTERFVSAFTQRIAPPADFPDFQ
jgi:hypothetical protein